MNSLMHLHGSLLLTLLILSSHSRLAAQDTTRDVVIIGGGAGGTMAGIQATRMNADVLMIEETRWIGGMLTAAGVSAIDGNHQMPQGLWGEFRERLYRHYGGPGSVSTGWVSNTLFEPAVGQQILRDMAAEAGVDIYLESRWKSVSRKEDHWLIQYERDGKSHQVRAKVLIDATELGDVIAYLEIPYDVGMDDQSVDSNAPAQPNDIIQDLTYVAILKDYGVGTNRIISKPANYNPASYECACGPSSENKLPCEKMLEYGKLPNDKYMINWPNCGNDYYANLLHMDDAERDSVIALAKEFTLGFVYYIQHELGYTHLGLAEGEFPTRDDLPLIPYHRESRRPESLVQLTEKHLVDPFGQTDKLYRTGIAVGDYPIDHHHDKHPEAPKIDFLSIKIPSFNVPLGTLIPKNDSPLIFCEKSIGVSNIVNGTTRLQPVVMGIGQASGALAALASRKNIMPHDVPVREIQSTLLSYDGYLMPYIDVKPENDDFEAIQRIGATGILKATGIPYKWANQTWFYPELPISQYDLHHGLISYYPHLQELSASGELVTMGFIKKLVLLIKPEIEESAISAFVSERINRKAAEADRLSRADIAALLDHFVDPFSIPVDHFGRIISTNTRP